MNICVFLGPTLPVDEAARMLDAVYLPPVAQGDVYLAVNDGAEVIGIVDGYFQGAPSVWHKEILWAISRGVHVFGSASMGALRAAELSEFGMQGVGRVFDAYRDGVLTDDDEVAVVHGPEELGYRARTVPLVNIRATLAKALEQELITQDLQETLLDVARSLFYWDRTYRALLEKSEGTVERDVLTKLRAWVSRHAVDQKRDDAVEMLARLKDVQSGLFRAAYHFHRTSAWQNLIDEVRARSDDRAPASTPDRGAAVLDELRLVPDLYRQILSAPTTRGQEISHLKGSRQPRIAGLIESGEYDHFSDRALDKKRVLNARFGLLPEYADAMLTPSEVLQWYFEDRCGTVVPMDLGGYAAGLGLTSSGELCRLLLHELLYEMSRDVGQANGVPI